MGYELALKNMDARAKMRELGLQVATLMEENKVSYRQIFLHTGVDYNSIKKIIKGEDVLHSSYIKVHKFLTE